MANIDKLHELDFYNYYVEDNTFEDEKLCDIVVEKINESELLIKSFKTAKIHTELDNYFSFRPEGYRFVPSYKNGYWDGYVRIYKKSKQRLPVGLIYPLIHFAYTRGYTIKIKYSFCAKKLEQTKVAKFIDTLQMDKSKTIRDYQFQAVFDALKNRRLVVQIVTSGGKSLVIYCLARYCIATNRKLLIVVPKISLVHQLFTDFIDYGWKETDEFVQKRCGGESKSLEKPIIISSWQSIYKNTEDLKDFKAIIIDECLDGETLISTPNGKIKIKDLKTGDKVYSVNEKTFEKIEDTVVKAFKNMSNSQSEKMYELEFDNGQILKVTGNHKILTKNKGMVRADELTETDEICEEGLNAI